MLGLQDHKKLLGTKRLCARQSPCHLSSTLSLNQTFSSVRTISVFLHQAWKSLGAGVASFTNQWQFRGKQLWTVFSRPALGHKEASCSKPWTCPGQIRNGQNLESIPGANQPIFEPVAMYYTYRILLMKILVPSFPFSFIKIKWYHLARVKNALKRTNRPACFYCLGRGGGGGRGEPCFSFFFFPLYKNNRRKAAAVISGNWRHFLRFYIKLVVFFPLHTQWTPVRSRLEKNRTNYASKPTNLPT